MRTLRSTFALVAFGLTFAAATTAAANVVAPPPTARVAAPVGTMPVALAATTTTATAATAVRATTDLRAFDRLLGTAGLRYQLNRPSRSYTVLAPTTAAVERVPARIRARFFQADNAGFQRLMNSHVVAGDVDLARLAEGTTLVTLSGEKLFVTHQPDGSILLNGVYRVLAAQQTANGHLYTLDRMIAPVQ